jgi:hypothetical protein
MPSESADLSSGAGSIYREYLLNVRIVERTGADGERRYDFEAPEHVGRTFEDPATAELYAAVYFDVNGFEEAGTGDRGVPPEILAAGRDTLAAYLLTQAGVDTMWVASFFGVKPEKVERYAERVRKRAEEIRSTAREEGVA